MKGILSWIKLLPGSRYPITSSHFLISFPNTVQLGRKYLKQTSHHVEYFAVEIARPRTAATETGSVVSRSEIPNCHCLGSEGHLSPKRVVFRSTQETEQMQQLDMESDVGEVVNVVNVIPEDQEPTEEQCLGERG